MNGLPQYNWGAEKHRWFGVSFICGKETKTQSQKDETVFRIF
jgi:hypothetical protein